MPRLLRRIIRTSTYAIHGLNAASIRARKLECREAAVPKPTRRRTRTVWVRYLNGFVLPTFSVKATIAHTCFTGRTSCAWPDRPPSPAVPRELLAVLQIDMPQPTKVAGARGFMAGSPAPRLL